MGNKELAPDLTQLPEKDLRRKLRVLRVQTAVNPEDGDSVIDRKKDEAGFLRRELDRRGKSE